MITVLFCLIKYYIVVIFLMALISLIGMPVRLNIVKVFMCGRKVFKICNTRYKSERRKSNMNIKLALCS